VRGPGDVRIGLGFILINTNDDGNSIEYKNQWNLRANETLILTIFVDGFQAVSRIESVQFVAGRGSDSQRPENWRKHFS
jgi:hypothetical protein